MVKPQNDRPHTRFHGRVADSDRPCAHPGCAEPGEFRAPPLEGAGAHDGPPRFRWFCLDHVRAFNAGMSADEIHQAQRPLAGWERETRAFSRTRMGDQGPRWADFSDPLDAIGAKYARTAPRAEGRALSGEDRRSLETLGLSLDADRNALRKRYSELVRRYHPDRNGGDRTHEAALRKVITAYQHLRRAPAFA